MTAYGRFEVLRELYTGRAGSFILVARASGETRADEIAVKAYSPPRTIIGRGAADRQLEAFLARVRAQQELGQLPKSAWAPILDSGRVDNEAFYITRLYPRSAQKLIDGRVRISSQALLAIAQGVVRGLGQIHTTASRAHGNLKPSNVLITSPDRVNESTIFLSDPETNERAGTGEREDLEALGRLLHELVVGTEAASGEDWSGSPDNAWSRLGSAARGWRDLSRRLINGSDDSLTLASLPTELRKIGSQRRLPVKSLLAMAVLLVASGLAAGWEVDQRAKFQKKWDAYQAAYKTTVLPLKHLASASQLEVRPEVEQELKSLNAHAVFSLIPESKPDYFPPFENAGINQNLDQAVAAADGLRDSWKTDRWALRNGLKQHAQLAGNQGFPQTASMLSSFVLDSLDHLTEVSGTKIPDSLPQDVVDQVAKAGIADASAAALLAQVMAFKKLGIQSADCELSASYRDLVTKGVTADIAKMLDDLKTLATKVQSQAAEDSDWKGQFIQRLDSAWAGTPDDPVARADQIFRETPLSQATDPRAGISDKLSQLKAKIDASSLPAPQRKPFSDGLDGIARAFRNNNSPWTPENKDDIRSYAESTLKQLGTIDTAIASFKGSGTSGNPGGGTMANSGNTGGNTGSQDTSHPTNPPKPPVDIAYHDELEHGVPPELVESRRQLRRDKWLQLKADPNPSQAAIAAMQNLVNVRGPNVATDVEKVHWPGNFPPGSDLEAAHRYAIKALATALNAAAEREFAKLLENLSPTTPDVALKDQRDQAALNATLLLGKCSDFLRKLDNFAKVNETDAENQLAPALDELKRDNYFTGAYLAGANADPPDHSIADAVSSLLSLGKIEEALKPTTDKEKVLDQLKSGSQGAHEAVALIGWRRLADFPDWPANPGERETEQASYAGLATKFGKTKELTTGETTRAQHYLTEAVKKSDNWQEVLATKTWFTQLAIPAKAISAEAQYDFALANLKANASSADVVAAFVAQYKDRSEVQSLIPKTVAGATATSGPGTIPMSTLTPGPDGTMRLEYRGQDALLFKYLGKSKCFMLRTDVSWKLFDRIANLEKNANGEKGWSLIRGDFQTNVKNDGLCAWHMAEGPRLLPHADGVWFEPVAQPGVPDLMQNLGSPPDDAPMNYVPPKAAQDLASLLHCRLPTLAEWTEACALDGRTAPKYQRPWDNRRDSAWVTAVKTERAAAESLRNTTSFGVCPHLMNGVFQNILKGRKDEDAVIIPDAAFGSDRIFPAQDNAAFFRGVNEGLFKDPKFRGKPEEVSPEILYPFSDLVGNVAQYVTNDAAAIGVVGASALSPADAPVDFQPVPAGYEKRGFSDVGFRLVYDAAATAPIGDVRGKVAEMPFLPL